MSLLLAVLAASLVGSPHCAGMCGAFVCFYSGGAAPGAPRAWLPHVAYNGGRLASYLLLGAVAGTAGAGLEAVGALAGLSRAAAIASGTLMVAWGLARLAAASGVRLGLSGAAPAALQARLGRALGAVRGRPPVVRAAATGLLTTLLPCGWLYAFVATAAGTASPLRGMLVMLAFWAGTLPMMAAAGVGVQRALGPLARRLPVASAALLVVLGLLSISGRLTADLALPRGTAAPVPTSHARHDAH